MNQGVVGRVLTRHVGLKPDLRSNELSGLKPTTFVGTFAGITLHPKRAYDNFHLILYAV